MQIIEVKGTYLFDPPSLTKKHKDQNDWKKTAFIKTDCDMHLYYKWFLTKRFDLHLKKPIRPYPHISFINDRINTPELIQKYEEVKAKYDGKEVTFLYSPELIRTNTEHWWIKVESKEAEAVRAECGLTPIPHFNMHLTLGEVIELPRHIEHSKYILRQITNFDL